MESSSYLELHDGQFTAQDLMANKNPPTYITIKCCSQVQMSKLKF